MVQAARHFLQERIKIAEAYFATKSVVQTQRQFRRDFPGRNSPTRFTKKHPLDEFRGAGAVKDNVEGRSGRPLSDKTENIMMIMGQCLERSPKKSTKRLSQKTDLSRVQICV